jgi:hypothetical protein
MPQVPFVSSGLQIALQAKRKPRRASVRDLRDCPARFLGDRMPPDPDHHHAAAYVGPFKSQNARMSSATKASTHAPA